MKAGYISLSLSQSTDNKLAEKDFLARGSQQYTYGRKWWIKYKDTTF
jgi:hypothetical protein